MTTQVKFLPRLRTHTREVKGKDWSEGKNGEWGWDAKNTFFSSRHTCPMGTWSPTHFARKYQAGASYLTKPILRKKRLFCGLRSSERLLYLQAKKSLSKLKAETRVLTYWSWSVLCCGTVWGRPFSTFVQPPRTCLETRRLSLNENLRATQGWKDETSLFFLLPMVSLRSKRFRSS